MQINSGDTDFRYNQKQKELINAIIADLKDIRDGFVSGTLDGSATWDPGDLADGDSEDKDVTITGVALGDFVVGVSFSLDLEGLALTAAVTATDTVTATITNSLGSNKNLASGTVRFLVFKKSFWFDLLPMIAARAVAT